VKHHCSDCQLCYVIAVVGLTATRTPGDIASLKTSGRTAVTAFKTQALDDLTLFSFHSEELYTPIVIRSPFWANARKRDRILSEILIDRDDLQRQTGTVIVPACRDTAQAPDPTAALPMPITNL